MEKAPYFYSIFAGYNLLWNLVVQYTQNIYKKIIKKPDWIASSSPTAQKFIFRASAQNNGEVLCNIMTVLWVAKKLTVYYCETLRSVVTGRWENTSQAHTRRCRRQIFIKEKSS